MNKEVIIIGLGWVGQANALALIKDEFIVHGIDIRTVNNIYKDPDFNKIKISDAGSFTSDAPKIICVNALNDEHGKQDLSAVFSALKTARQIGGGPVILRSTVLPTKFKNLDFDLFVPEFLHELHAIEEARKPSLLVIGSKKSADNLPQFLLHWKKSAKRVLLGTPEEAAFIKYLSNIWNALRISHVNEMGNIMRRRGMNHEKVLDFFFERKPYLKYGREFSGHCLPKDALAFLTEFNEEAKLISAMHESNEDHKRYVKEHHPDVEAQYFRINEA